MTLDRRWMRRLPLHALCRPVVAGMLVILAAQASAQDVVTSIIPVGLGFQPDDDSKLLGLFPNNSDAFECATPPTADEVRAARFATALTVMTADEAAKLKISFMGTHGASFDRSQQVIVSQVGRLKSCVARDGKTRLFYGHVVRTTVLLSNYKIEGEASLAIVAAQATIKGASNRVELEAIGIPDEDVQLKLQEAKNTLGGPSLKVENFQDFDKKRGEAETAAVRSRRASSELIGIEGEALDEPAIAVLLARAFALQQISYLYDCQRAIRDHGDSSPAIANAIQQTYEQIAGKCQPDAVAQARARKLLGPFSIRR